MKKIIFIVMAVLLSGCGTNIIEQLKLETGERGSVCVRGQVDINPFPFMTSNANFVYKEAHQDFEEPQC